MKKSMKIGVLVTHLDRVLVAKNKRTGKYTCPILTVVSENPFKRYYVHKVLLKEVGIEIDDSKVGSLGRVKMLPQKTRTSGLIRRLDTHFSVVRPGKFLIYAKNPRPDKQSNWRWMSVSKLTKENTEETFRVAVVLLTMDVSGINAENLI